MSHAIQAIVGVVEIVAGVLIDIYTEGTGGNWLILTGVSQLLGYAASLLLNPHRAPLIPFGVAYAGTLEPRRLLFGALYSTRSDREDCMNRVLAAVDRGDER